MYLPFLSVIDPSGFLVRQVHLASTFLIVTLPGLIALLDDRKSVAHDLHEIDE